MGVLRRLLMRVLPIALLIAVLFVGVSGGYGRSSGSKAIEESVQNSYQIFNEPMGEKDSNEPSLDIDSRIDRKSMQRRRRKPNQLSTLQNDSIQYELFVQDIIGLFKRLDSSDMNLLRWVKLIEGGDCQGISPCNLEIRDVNQESPSRNSSFLGLSSKKYIDRILLYVDNIDRNKVTDIEIFFKTKRIQKFQVSKIHPMLTDEKFVPIDGAKQGNCDGPCTGGSRVYLINTKMKHFPSSQLDHMVYIKVYVAMIDGTNGLSANPGFGSERLHSLRLRTLVPRKI
jgi:hypothetical protein